MSMDVLFEKRDIGCAFNATNCNMMDFISHTIELGRECLNKLDRAVESLGKDMLNESEDPDRIVWLSKGYEDAKKDRNTVFMSHQCWEKFRNGDRVPCNQLVILFTYIVNHVDHDHYVQMMTRAAIEQLTIGEGTDFYVI